jgi:hypothetical protein
MAHALQTAEELRQHVQAIRIGAAGTAKTTRKLRTTGFSQDINASACAKIRIRMSSFMLSGTSNGNHSNIVCDKASEETFKVLWGLLLDTSMAATYETHGLEVYAADEVVKPSLIPVAISNENGSNGAAHRQIGDLLFPALFVAASPVEAPGAAYRYRNLPSNRYVLPG